MTEIADFGALVLAVAAGLAFGVLSTKVTERVPVPAPAVFLVAAAAVSDLWPSVYASVPVETVERIAVVALVVILFNGGMDIGWRRLRPVVWSTLSLGIVGTFATAGLVAVVAHFALGFDWIVAGLVGAALAPTDPAVMFSVVGGREIRGRSGTLLEGEAGVNDPAGIALMLGMIELATHEGASFLVVLEEFAVEMAVGLAFGLAGAVVLRRLLSRLALPNETLYPVFALLLAGALYGATSLAHGSGFLAVFVAGLFLADAEIRRADDVRRFHASLAGLAELAVFVALGLTIPLSSLDARVWLEGGVLAVVLAFVARPLVVAGTLPRAGLGPPERLFVMWSGLKGAVPILLAAFAVLAGAPDAERVYVVVFVVVLVSVLGQGTLVPAVANRLRLLA